MNVPRIDIIYANIDLCLLAAKSGVRSPALARFENICDRLSIPPKLTQLSTYPRSVSEYQLLLGTNL